MIWSIGAEGAVKPNQPLSNVCVCVCVCVVVIRSDLKRQNAQRQVCLTVSYSPLTLHACLSTPQLCEFCDK